VPASFLRGLLKSLTRKKTWESLHRQTTTTQLLNRTISKNFSKEIRHPRCSRYKVANSTKNHLMMKSLTPMMRRSLCNSRGYRPRWWPRSISCTPKWISKAVKEVAL
jgi:hypothetical protein